MNTENVDLLKNQKNGKTGMSMSSMLVILILCKGKIMDNERPSTHTYFMNMAKLAATRSTCLCRQYGAVIVRYNMVISTGYNGAVKKEQHCSEIGCLRTELGIPAGENYELCRSVHAEANAIIQAAYTGAQTKGASLYVNGIPCQMCARMIINAGIREVYVPAVEFIKYHTLTEDIFENSDTKYYILP
jgi:dCMP deaminase